MKNTLALLRSAFIKSWRLYTGVTLFNFNDLPRIGGEYYIHKPKIIEYKNTRTKKTGLLQITAELPQSYPASPPEYIVLVIYISYSICFRPRDYIRAKHVINRRLKLCSGDSHIHIYILVEKATAGVYEHVKRDFARLRNRGSKTVFLKVVKDPETIVNDMANYVGKRLEKLLDPRKYVKSRYEVFGRPKRLIEYLMLLYALLHRKENHAEHIAWIMHSSARVPIQSLIDIYNEIRNEEEAV